MGREGWDKMVRVWLRWEDRDGIERDVCDGRDVKGGIERQGWDEKVRDGIKREGWNGEG